VPLKLQADARAAELFGIRQRDVTTGGESLWIQTLFDRALAGAHPAIAAGPSSGVCFASARAPATGDVRVAATFGGPFAPVIG
jgi:hypothetical protein